VIATLVELHADLTVGDLAVAVGTLALAGFTWALARQTKREVRKTDEGLALSRQSLEAVDMPFVIATPIEGAPALIFSRPADGEGTEWELGMRLWNVGKGPGLIHDISLVAGRVELLDPLAWMVPVAAEQAADIYLSVSDPPPRGLGEEEAEATLRIHYRHALGTGYATVSNVEVRGTYAQCRDYVRDTEPQGGRPLSRPAFD
jgi:hypothetical protein